MNEPRLLDRIRQLPPDKREEVFAFIESVEEQVNQEKQRRCLEGALSHLNLHVNAEDIDQARREMWGEFPRSDI
jgi:hypothetical protein